MKLEDYKTEVEKLQQMYFEIFKTAEETSVYEVILHFRDSEDLISYGTLNSVLKSFASVEKYILKARSFFCDDCTMGERAYWSVTKYKLMGGEFKEDITCCFSINAKLLSVNLAAALRGVSNSMMLRHSELMKRPKSVTVSYKKGDIIEIDPTPFEKPIYVVYGGDAHLCIYESEDRRGLWIDSIADSGFTDYALFEHSPLIMSKWVKNCNNEKIIRASERIRAEPHLWHKCLKFYKCNGMNEENLDSLILK